MNLDFNKIVEYIASGNLTVLILTCIILILVAWIKYEDSIRRLLSYLRYDLFDRNKEEVEKERNAFDIRNDLFMNRISLKIIKIESLHLSKDVGRNALYHYLVKTMLSMLRDKFTADLTAYKNGDLSKEKFCSYYLYHKQGIENFKIEYSKIIEEKLKKDDWSDENIAYVINMFNQWSSSYFELLAELISTCKIPDSVIMSWWVFFYEIYITLEKFSISINGRITGNTFEKIKIGKPR
jgi:hypothetical protein